MTKVNPCNGSKPLVQSPEEYAYSSYPGYARKSRRVDWISYDDHHRYWQGLNGGTDPAVAYRKYVKDGLVNPVDPTLDRLKDWVYGGTDFLNHMLSLADGDDLSKNQRRRRRTSVVSMADVINATAREYQVPAEEYEGFRSGAGGRDVAAYLCRRYTTSTLAAISSRFGLSHPDSSSDLIKRGESDVKSNAKIRSRAMRIEDRLGLNPESRI